MFVPEFALFRRSAVVLLTACAMPAVLSGQTTREDSTDWSPAGVPAWRLGLAHSPVSAASAGTLSWTCVSACVRPASVAAEGDVAPAPGLVVAAGSGKAGSSNGQPFRGDGAIGAPSSGGTVPLSLLDVGESEDTDDDEAGSDESSSDGAPAARGSSNGRAVPVFAAAAVGLGAVMYATQNDGRAAPSREIASPQFLPLRQPTLELDPSLSASATSTTVPEPAAMSMLLVGLAGLGARRRRTR